MQNEFDELLAEIDALINEGGSTTEPYSDPDVTDFYRLADKVNVIQQELNNLRSTVLAVSKALVKVTKFAKRIQTGLL